MRVWTTLDRPLAEQFPYWREVLCEAFTALNPVAEVSGVFGSTVASKEVGEITISDVASCRQLVSRSRHEISRTPSDYFFANLQLRGHCLVRQDGREALIRPGEFAVVDTTRPYTLDLDDWSLICVRVPRPLLLPLLRSPRAATAVRVQDDGALGTIASTFIRSLLRCPEEIDPAAQHALTQSLVQLIATALGATDIAREQGRAAVRKGLRDAVVAHIENHLADPRLSTGHVAAKFQVSTRYLQKLFEESGQTLGQIVQEKRLERCAQDLRRPDSRGRSISAIADQWGFGDASHFCRLFRKRHGVSASDYRRSYAEAVGRGRDIIHR